MNSKLTNYLLVAILLLAAVLRLANLGSGDVIGSDEALYAFRAVGMLDYDVAEFQPTPLELADPDIPWWTKFSFHDHPPLVFFVQHVFMKVFGENNFGFRLPSAILGILSVWLIFLVGREMCRRTAPALAPVLGLVAAAISAVTVNHVYISRLGIQEAYVIFFLLLSSYLFLRSLDDSRYLLWLGAALGLAFLTKYTTAILVPIFLTYLVIFRRDYFKNRRFWLAVLIALAVSSPIIIYNLGLYARFGHFDFQLSYVFGQNPEIWKVAPGKEEIGTLGDRLRNFIPNFYKTSSWGFSSFFLLSIPLFAWLYVRRGKTLIKQKAFADIALAWLILLLLAIGPTTRFLTVLTPFIAIEIAWLFMFCCEKLSAGRRKIALGGLVAFVVLAILYSINSLIIGYPVGPQFWTWSAVRFDTYNWGYNELDGFLRAELDGKRPAISFNMRYRFLQEVSNRALADTQLRELQPLPALIIYDDNVQNAAQLWILDRLQIYHGWPVLKLQAYLQMFDQLGPDFFSKAGFRNYYFITPTNRVPWKKSPTDLGLQFEQQFAASGFSPIVLQNKKGDDVFRIYKY